MINRVTPKIKKLQIIGLGILPVVFLGACAGGAGHGDPGAPRHVFEIVMENKSAEEALTGERVSAPIPVSHIALWFDSMDWLSVRPTGIAVRDVIVRVDNESVSSMGALVVSLRTRKPGDKVSVGYIRDGQWRTAQVTLAQRPKNP